MKCQSVRTNLRSARGRHRQRHPAHRGRRPGRARGRPAPRRARADRHQARLRRGRVRRVHRPGGRDARGELPDAVRDAARQGGHDGRGAVRDHPVQRAFAAHDALQCGYCTPGFIVEAVAFVDAWRAREGDVAPSRAQIADALAGHLCRCGAYASIYAAVAAACTGAHDEPGARPARIEAMEKITGRARYTTDIRLPGQLEGVFVRSTSAHAVVRSVKAPGGAVLVDLLAEDRTVRYVGQPIAAVTGPTRAVAAATAREVLVEYDELPAVLDPEHAQRQDAPVIYGSKAARKAAPSSGEGAPSLPDVVERQRARPVVDELARAAPRPSAWPPPRTAATPGWCRRPSPPRSRCTPRWSRTAASRTGNRTGTCCCTCPPRRSARWPRRRRSTGACARNRCGSWPSTSAAGSARRRR